ncbi:hypothetical protein Y032_0607g592 [Ancylostoma ceylanicum]|uniref:Uncharacterized protein n=1 Tax=Ancylostoma ceylanicum TaxID=53326 RepID=A0A016WLR7_9BILA|nr:hypothetical protein Y032_0607g592 [Ancylostoma ceylanicum]
MLRARLLPFVEAIQKRVGVGVFIRGKHNDDFDGSRTFYLVSRTLDLLFVNIEAEFLNSRRTSFSIAWSVKHHFD